MRLLRRCAAAEVMSVDSRAYLAALAIADGDDARLKIINARTILVLNEGHSIMVQLRD